MSSRTEGARQEAGKRAEPVEQRQHAHAPIHGANVQSRVRVGERTSVTPRAPATLRPAHVPADADDVAVTTAFRPEVDRPRTATT